MKHSIYIPDSLEPNIFNDKAHIQVGGKNIMKVANDVSFFILKEPFKIFKKCVTTDFIQYHIL